MKSYLSFTNFWIYHFEHLSFSNSLPNVSAQLFFSSGHEEGISDKTSTAPATLLVKFNAETL